MNRLPPRLLAAALVALAVAATYAPVLRFEFVWDDHDLVARNPLVTGEGGPATVRALFGAGFASSPFTASPGPYYRPLTVATFAADWALWNGSAAGFHLTNLLLHALVSYLVWSFLAAQGVAGPFALGGALLFALHPAHAEPASWVSGRTDLLATGLALASLLAARRAWWAAVALFAAALFAKESAVVTPLLLAACRLGEPWRGRAGGRALAAIGGMAVALAGYAVLRASALAGAGELPAQGASEALPRAARALLILGEGARVLLWPHPLAPLRDAPGPAWGSGLLAPAAGLVALLALAAWCAPRARRRRNFGRPILFFAAAMLPVLGFVELVVPFAERFLYLPSVGFVWAIAAAAEGLGGTARARRRAALAGLALLALAGGFAARRHAGVWRDDPTLFRAIVERHPRSVPAWNEMGVSLAERGDFTGARAALERAIALDPAYAPAHFNLSRVLDRQGDLAGALREVELALRFAPGSPSVIAVRDRLRARMSEP